MAVTEPPGKFDYLLEGLGDTDEDLDNFENLGYDEEPVDEDLGFDDDFEDDDVEDDDFEFVVDSYPAPPVPWYRTTAALLAIGAMGLAGIAILVSAVLLVSRNSRGPAPSLEPTTAITTTATATSAPATSEAAETPPPATEAPPSAPTGSPVPASPAEPPASAPTVVVPRQTEPARPPQIGVTRTNITRLPYSVKPPPVPHF